MSTRGKKPYSTSRADHVRPKDDAVGTQLDRPQTGAAHKALATRADVRRGDPRPWDQFVHADSPFATLLAVAWFEAGEDAPNENKRRHGALRLMGYKEGYIASGGRRLFERQDVQAEIRRIQRVVREGCELDASDLAWKLKCMIEVSPADVMMKLKAADPGDEKLPNNCISTLDALAVLTPEERYAISEINYKNLAYKGGVTAEWYDIKFESRPAAMKQLAVLGGLNAPAKLDVEGAEGIVALIRAGTELAQKRSERPAIEDVEWEEVTDADPQE